MEEYKLTALDNGIKVVTENVPGAKSFALGFWFQAGTRNEPAGLNGIAHFVEHMIFKGTEKRSAKKITFEIESLGGYLNAFTAKEYTCFYAHGTAGNFEKTFEVLSDIIQNPVFREEDIKREKQVVCDEIYDSHDSPEDLIFDEFESLIFKDSSLELPILGKVETVMNFKRDDLFKFIEKNYGANNLIVSFCGNLRHEKIVEMVDKFFNGFRKVDLRKPGQFAHYQPQKIHIRKEINQSHLILGSYLDGYRSKNRILARLFSVILGEGSGSRLFQSLREENGIAYQVNSFLNSYMEISAFGIYLSTNGKKLPFAVDLIYKEIDNLTDKKITTAELQRAKEYLKGSYILSLESFPNRMQKLAHSLHYYGEIKMPEEIIKDIESVTADMLYGYMDNLSLANNFSTVIVNKDIKALQNVA